MLCIVQNFGPSHEKKELSNAAKLKVWNKMSVLTIMGPDKFNHITGPNAPYIDAIFPITIPLGVLGGAPTKQGPFPKAAGHLPDLT